LTLCAAEDYHAHMPIDPELLRTVMRHWPTGVTVLAARHGDVTHGMTVNSFSSVALDPPLVLASIEQSVRTHTLIEQSGAFALSFLRAGQEWISNRFAGRDTEHQNRFADLETFTAVTGAPILADNIGYLDCVVVAAHPAGNHTVFIAEVVAAGPGTAGPVLGDDGLPQAANGAQDGTRPLLYFNRDYRRMA
jgi:flavin reductase (DIM6/NTAB) family NADH-FMN oxidoreductase RutF